MPLDIHPERSRIELTDLNKDDRSRLRGIIVGACLLGALVAVLMIYAGKLWAEEIPVYVHEQNGLSIKLFSQPCTDPTSQMMVYQMAPQYFDRLKALASVWRMKEGGNKPFAGCWFELTKDEAQAAENLFVLIFEDGDRYVIPRSEFLKKPGQGGV